MIGQTIAHYRITAKLGAGGMGEVYRAVDTKLDREVALKILPEQFARDTERMTRFEREAKVLASLNHPNIAQIYGVENRALVMELVEGVSPKGPMSFDDSWKITSQIASALEYAHERGIVHRDLKPDNIKVTPDGVVKLLDFGLAKAFTEQKEPSANPEHSPTLTIGATEVGVILGTAAYMAPEQAKGKAVDKRADIWAFGVVFYELLTGGRPFKGEDVSETLVSVLRDKPNFAKVPLNARRLLRRCLEKDPKQRLRDIGEAHFLLEGVEAPSGPKSKLAWIVAVGVLTIALAVVSVIAWRATRPVNRPLIRVSMDLGPRAVAASRITAAISPDGRRIAFVAREEGGKELLATRLLDQSDPTLLTGTEGAADPFFSPDSQWIGFFADSKLKKISVQGGAAVTLCDAADGRGASWGEDGNIVVTVAAVTGSGLSRIPEAGGALQHLTKPADTGDVQHRWPQVLPGASAVLFTAGTTPGDWENASIKVLSLKTNKLVVVAQGGYFGRYLPISDHGGELVYVHQGTLFGVPFDLDHLKPRGTAAPLLEDVQADSVAGGGQFDFSQNGAFLYRGGKSNAAGWPLVWLDIAGKTEPVVSAPGVYLSPRISPDSRRIAFSENFRDIEVYDPDRRTATKLTFGGRQNTNPVWSPDGKHLVFRSQGTNGVSLIWIRSDGAGEPQPLLESENDSRPYSFAPDGKRLAFVQLRKDTGWGLYTLPLDSSDADHPKAGKAELFLRTSSQVVEAAFSHDGRWIAYRASSPSTANEIYVQSFPGPGGKWLIGPGRYPIWSPDDRQLFYAATDDHVMVASYSVKGDSFFADKPRVWSSVQIFQPSGVYQILDLAPDGKRFVMSPKPGATSDHTGSVHVTMLLNFFDELRRRVPVK
jgi:serine/threonine-protein kinase